jgi:ectoine hydroxylase-related dioxygenase (phytanoyl-CoA dioxygenase family)
VPHSNWHLDYQPHADLTRVDALQTFAFILPSQPGGGATVAIAGSHRLAAQLAAAGGANFDSHSAHVSKALQRMDPWFRELCTPGEAEQRRKNLMDAPTTIHGVEIRVVEFTGEPGDLIVMHPWLLHSIAPNVNQTPRMMLAQQVSVGGLSYMG